MKLFTVITFFLFSFSLLAQNASIKGQLQDDKNEAVIYANIALHNASDSTMVKVETSDVTGIFNIQGIKAGNYFLKVSYVGLADLEKKDLVLTDGQVLDLGVIKMATAATDLEEVTVTAQRALVEVKPDRTVFNVQGTINSVGDDALSLLRKAPGVNVDNNDNVNVLGRGGVQIYVDGKPLPLTGADLAGYLQNIPAEQIDRIDIITNPGAKYEAEGNAGIIDIRMKRDKNLGTNGSLSTTYSKGRHYKYNVSGTANYRNKNMNVFGNAGFGQFESFNDHLFDGFQNGLRLNEVNNSFAFGDFINYRVGVDFFIGKKQTLGFLVSGADNTRNNEAKDVIEISQESMQSNIDSVLVANNTSDNERNNNTFNINYRYDIGKGKSLNVDLDYGRYKNTSIRFQPNLYYNNVNQDILFSSVINAFDTPTDIDIYTAKIDFEYPLAGGQLGLGSKFSRVVSDNVFLFFDEINGVNIRNDVRSNRFDYDENVAAGYITYNRPIDKKWSFAAGLRAEQTDAVGNLQPFLVSLQEPPVDLNYLSWFPNAGLTYNPKQGHTFNLSYGRRINRPDYNVLNPFNNRLSELSYEKGNPFLRPEIVNNFELGYTLKYRYNFKIAYSKTDDQITRLIAPDEEDPRAGFITWDNLASQTVFSANISAPMQINKKWSAFFNISANRIDNQADYGDGKVIDLQAFSYSIFSQQTFDLPGGFKGEVSGYYSGPGVWGGVFEYESSWSLNLGLQKKFFQKRMNVKLSFSDIFYESGWDGVSDFAGAKSFGSGRYDSRRAAISVSYNFGNENVKSRKRKTGIEDESKRVGG